MLHFENPCLTTVRVSSIVSPGSPIVPLIELKQREAAIADYINLTDFVNKLTNGLAY